MSDLLDPEPHSKFRENLEVLINQHSMENGSETPDFILAEYLRDSLVAFDKAVNARVNFYASHLKVPT